MSVSGFFSSIADKAQNAINQKPLAGHVHGTSPPGGSGTNPAASPGGYRSFALESLQHQIRSIGQQYTSATPLQRIITLEKGVALDFDALSRDGKSQSKELYTWGQNEDPDLTDVTDRLAFLNFVHGSLSASLAVKLDGARAPLKALRDAEAAIVPKRNIRAGLRNQIARMEHNQERGGERRLAELKEQLLRAENNDEQLEKELELLKRKAIRESEQRKWEAIQEYGEKLVLLSQGVKPIIGALPSLPPTSVNPYVGAQVTAAARASLQHALDNYKLGQVDLHLQIKGDLSRSDTRSFGESHASELNSLVSPLAGHDSHPGLSVTPPIPEPGPVAKEDYSASSSTQASANPGGSALIPEGPDLTVAHDTGPEVTPKATEPLSEDLYNTSPVKTESTEEVRQVVEREQGEGAPAISTEGRLPDAESAEEEKKRLEREERERVLAGGANPATRARAENTGEELPPYQDIQE